jgi:hypothetical protein
MGPRSTAFGNRSCEQHECQPRADPSLTGQGVDCGRSCLQEASRSSEKNPLGDQRIWFHRLVAYGPGGLTLQKTEKNASHMLTCVRNSSGKILNKRLTHDTGMTTR